MKKSFDYFITRWKNYNKAKNAFSDFSSYLSNGEYLFNWDFSSAEVVHLDKANQAATKEYAKDNKEISRLKQIILDILKQKNLDNGGAYHCEKVMMTSSNTIKGFDFYKDLVITQFLSDQEMKQYLQQKDKASIYFHCCNTVDTLKEDDVIIEQRLIDRSNSAVEKFEKVLDYYIANQSIKTRETICIPVYTGEEKCHAAFQKWYDELKIHDMRFPRAMQHGDLWDGNVFIDKNEITLIDFDKMDYHSCFYDILLFIFSEAFTKDDTTLLKLFFAGKYDSGLKALLHIDSGDNIKKEVLYVSFLNEMFSSRFQNTDTDFLHSLLNTINKWNQTLGIL